ncbi:hypothetical protein [Hymenobacter sp. UYP22]|uniref:hypothetical protein n=1 Tax=Hymenobacter sp. UYP22 TaxID=3156348 RepID=UPI0033953585
MNFILHTMAAHQQLSARPEARPHHVSLYWALFYQWNAARFATGLLLDHAALMQAARIGNERTYRATLYDLDTWGLLTYQPSQSRHEKSRCYLTDLSEAEVPPVAPLTTGRSAPDKTALPGAEVPEALRAEVPPISGLSGAEVPEDTLYSKTVDVNCVVVNRGTAAPHQKKIAVLEGEGLSGAELLDDTAPPTGADPAPTSAPKEKVAPKRKGVKQAAIRAAATGQASHPDRPARRGRQQLPEVPFAESELADVEKFIQAFDGTDYQLADLRFYHAKIQAWRDRKTGEPPRRRDWKACATQFFLNDAHENRLKLAPHVQRRPDGTLHEQPPAGDFFAATGFKSKYDQ